MSAIITYPIPLSITELEKLFARELASEIVWAYVEKDASLDKYDLSDSEIEKIAEKITDGVAEVIKNDIVLDLNELNKKLQDVFDEYDVRDVAEIKNIDITHTGKLEVTIELDFEFILREAVSSLAYEIFTRNKEDFLKKYKEVYERERDSVISGLEKRSRKKKK
jgi:hypothetical protein